MAGARLGISEGLGLQGLGSAQRCWVCSQQPHFVPVMLSYPAAPHGHQYRHSRGARFSVSLPLWCGNATDTKHFVSSRGHLFP